MTGGRWTQRLFAALVAGAVAPLVIDSLPAINGVFAQAVGAGPGMLGVFSSADAGGIGVGGLLAVPLMSRVSPRITLILGLVLLLMADFASALLNWGNAIVAWRAVGGMGTGLVLSVCTYVFGLEHQERNYATNLLSLKAVGAIAIIAIPILSHAFGWRSIFVCLGALLIPALAMAKYFPTNYAMRATDHSLLATAAPNSAWIGLGAVMLSTFGQGAFFPYLARVGSAAGLSEATVAACLSVAGVCSFLGAAAAVALGQRVSGMLPIALIVLLGISGAAVAYSDVAWLYAVGISAFYFAVPLYATAQFGFLMRGASSERFAVKISAATLIGYAFGPAIGGLIIVRLGFGTLEWFNVITGLGSLVLLWAYLRARLESHQRPAPGCLRPNINAAIDQRNTPSNMTK